MPVRTKISLLAVLSLMPGLGCDKIVALINDGAQAAANEAGGGLTGGPKTDDDRLGEKLQAYIDCINGPATNISDSGKRYFDWIDDPKVGPTGKETSVYGLYEIRDTKPCLDGIAKAAELEPDDADLEAAAKAFADAVSTAAPLMNEAYKYYDEDNYKDDKWAKAKELHPKLLAAIETFEGTNAKLREIVGNRNDALQERDLSRIEAEMGKTLMWHQRKIMVLSKKVMDTADVEVAPEFKLDLAVFEPLVNELETELSATEEYGKAHKEELDSVTMYSSFQSEAEEFKKIAKEVLRRKRDNQAFTKDDLERFASGPASWVEGSPAKLLDKYNSLVSRSNSLNYSFYKPAPKG
jgi:hypothetical protein